MMKIVMTVSDLWQDVIQQLWHIIPKSDISGMLYHVVLAQSIMIIEV